MGSSFGCLDSSNYHPWVKMIEPAFTSLVLLWQINYLGLHPLKWWWNKLAMKPQRDNLDIVTAKVSERIGLGTQRPDFMQGLIGDGEKTGMDFGRLVQNANLLIIAGSETTATLLTAATYFLTMHPEFLGKVVNEVRSTFESDEDITIHSVSRLSYMLACLDESLRCFPPAPGGFPRVCPNDQWAVNRDAKFWTEPNRFDPERFLGGARYKSDKLDALQAFSVGPRNCLGKNLAYAEMRLILAKVLFHFDMAIAEDSRDWVQRSGAYAVWVKPSLNVHLTPRVR
ncbi:hypothetical protein GQX73_g10576 [Xylaria multiplex]|uniref:Cytochrome P450 n=1 Tax=Xylaria multiplex TaxID=323545 RepID=A0A7C8MZR6_9PEZI|nr:hypothetical protein GQX73_g10576 [Xylaria multiplex]